LEREVLAVDSGTVFHFWYFVDCSLVKYCPIIIIIYAPFSQILEFNQVLQNDSCRLSQLQCQTASPNHPVNKFSWGMFPQYIKYHFMFNSIF
jgi:hypothetical protein